MLDQLHSAVFQVDETDSHPPQQLQVFRVVGHEVLSPQWRTSHPRLPEWKEFQTLNTNRVEAAASTHNLFNPKLYRPVMGGTGATLVHSTADWFPQVAREGGVREQEAGVGAGPVKVGVVQLFL